jgi:signal transduction histidine kinase
MHPAGSLTSDPPLGWMTRALDIPSRLGRLPALALIASGMAAVWVTADLSGGAANVSLHWFYLPIILATFRFRYVGALASALAASVAAGPLLPLDTRLGTPQPADIWVPRAFFFVLIALLVAALVDRARTTLERELHLARDERDLARRQAAVIASVSHEFRTPLTVIKGVARTLETQQLPPDAARELLGGLTEAAERLSDLVSMVTTAVEDPGPVEAVRRSDVPLSATLLRLLDRLVALDARERVELLPGSEDVVVATDALTLERILRELVQNALKFSPPDTAVSVWAERRDPLLEIHVLDRGPGITDDVRDRAFDPFVRGEFSLTSSAGGIGVGLPAAGILARQLGGTLRLAPAEGGGTEAVLGLPE